MCFSLFPSRVWMFADVSIIVMRVSCDLGTQKGRVLKGFIYSTKFDFSKDEAFVLAMKLINLNGMFTIRNEVTSLLYASIMAEGKKFASIGKSNFFFPFEAADTICRRSLNSEIALIATSTHTHRMTVTTTNIALQYL